MCCPRNLLAVALILLMTSASAQLFPDLEGPDLLDQLVLSYKPAAVLSYSNARDSMYARIYNVNDSVHCVYSGHSLYLPSGEDPSIALYLSGDADGINTEHTWPQSMGASDGQPKSDLHHLFPSRIGVNAARDNFPFADIPDGQTTQWYYQTQVLSGMPSVEIDRYSERINGLFEPREDHKGNVARALFYFYTMYQNEITDPQFFIQQQETLCNWHFLDPADSLEIVRTWMIAGYQDGKPNPYVVDCTLAVRSFCAGTSGECPEIISATGEIHIPELLFFPNPTTGEFLIELPSTSAGPYQLTITDLMGQAVFGRKWSAGETIDIHSLPAGTYLIFLKNEKERFVGKLVKE